MAAPRGAAAELKGSGSGSQIGNQGVRRAQPCLSDKTTAMGVPGLWQVRHHKTTIMLMLPDGSGTGCSCTKPIPGTIFTRGRIPTTTARVQVTENWHRRQVRTTFIQVDASSYHVTTLVFGFANVKANSQKHPGLMLERTQSCERCFSSSVTYSRPVHCPSSSLMDPRGLL